METSATNGRSFAPIKNRKAMRVVVAFVGWITRTLDDRPLRAIKLGKSSIARDIGIYLREIDPRNQRKGLIVDLGTADDERLVVTFRNVNGILQIVYNNCPGKLEVALASNDDRSASWKQTSDRLEGLPSHDNVVPHRELFEPFQIRG